LRYLWVCSGNYRESNHAVIDAGRRRNKADE